ncbi:hypothetical protein JOL62DRAFT_269872 [Phyllosticta paracitricarpa]|uniref:Uncharacterized protein n=1 Tax=Phyllosticta paracitricarpa TaxID=2016321 RepID=A0ABR1N083_9PEZI
MAMRCYRTAGCPSYMFLSSILSVSFSLFPSLPQSRPLAQSLVYVFLHFYLVCLQSVSQSTTSSRQKERQTGFPASTNTGPIHHHPQPPQQLLSSVSVRQSLPFTARRTWSTFLLWPQPPLSSGHRSRSAWLVSALLWGFLYVCMYVGVAVFL